MEPDECCSCGHRYHSIPDQLSVEGTSKSPQKPQKPHACFWQWFTLLVLPVHPGNYPGLLQVNSKIFWQRYIFKIILRRHFRLNFRKQLYQNIFKRFQKSGRAGWEWEAGKGKLALLQWFGIQWAFPRALLPPWSSPALSDIPSFQGKRWKSCQSLGWGWQLTEKSFWAWEASHGFQMVYMETTHVVWMTRESNS